MSFRAFALTGCGCFQAVSLSTIHAHVVDENLCLEEIVRKQFERMYIKEVGMDKKMEEKKRFQKNKLENRSKAHKSECAALSNRGLHRQRMLTLLYFLVLCLSNYIGFRVFQHPESRSSATRSPESLRTSIAISPVKCSCRESGKA